MSLFKVADVAGVSVATVSRVINDRPGISRNTRGAVFKAIEEVGYKRKPISSRPGRKLAPELPQSFSSVAFLSFAKYTSQTHSPVYAEIIHGVEFELTLNGITMIFKNVNEEHDICSWLQNVEVDGLLLFASSETYIESVNSGNTKIPVVAILGETEKCWCDKITYDRVAVSDRAFEYINTLGCSELLEIHKSNHSPRLAELAKENGFRIERLAERMEDVFISNEKENHPDQAALDQRFEAYLSKNALPKIIFLPCDAFAVPVYSILMRRGYVAGVDFYTVSVNNEKSLLNGLLPKPATVDIRSYEMGRAAVQRLMWRKDNLQQPRMTLTIDPLLVMPDGSVSGI